MTISHELLTAALEGLELQKTRIEEQIANVRSMLGIRKRGRPPKSAVSQPSPKPARKRRKMSAAGPKENRGCHPQALGGAEEGETRLVNFLTGTTPGRLLQISINLAPGHWAASLPNSLRLL